MPGNFYFWGEEEEGGKNNPFKTNEGKSKSETKQIYNNKTFFINIFDDDAFVHFQRNRKMEANFQHDKVQFFYHLSNSAILFLFFFLFV